MDADTPEAPPENASQSALPEPQPTDYFGWFKSTLSQSTDIWNSIKRDITEVAHSVATSDSLSAARGTASSVYRQFSDAVQNLQQEGAKAEPLPEETKPSPEDYPTEDIDFSMQFSHLKSSFTGIVSALEKGISELTGGNFNFNFGSSEGGTPNDNREARIEVICADPATYEQPPSTTQKDILSYSSWRSAYFNESTYCPHPGIPVFEGESIPDGSDVYTTTTYPPPAQVLEESPVVRSHLLRLIDPDGVNNGGIQESDFWSRYYYRIWCLDVLELRRSRLSRINVGGDGKKSEKEESDTVDAWPELVEGVEPKEGSGANIDSSPIIAVKQVKEEPEGGELVSKETETILSSPASSVVLVTREEMTGSSEEGAEDRSDDDEEDLTQQEPRADTNESEDDMVALQLTAESLKEEAEEMEKGLSEFNADDGDGKSDPVSHYISTVDF
ncbi:unnamed protein product [Rodentolepis nana]|uniref:BSD domain-containing protein n=1 Tax=Rodentolepis nana TaxID=102285 RepID=A0A158QGL9_RODNA|nr:unnamed protein product [Rodentolepis nana]